RFTKGRPMVLNVARMHHGLARRSGRWVLGVGELSAGIVGARGFVRGSCGILGTVWLLAEMTGAVMADPGGRWIRPDAASGTSAAVVVDGGLPLAHTAQLWPEVQGGTALGAGRADAQAGALLDRLDAVLQEVGSALDRLVRVHVYAARADVLPAFHTAFARPI